MCSAGMHIGPPPVPPWLNKESKIILFGSDATKGLGFDPAKNCITFSYETLEGSWVSADAHIDDFEWAITMMDWWRIVRNEEPIGKESYSEADKLRIRKLFNNGGDTNPEEKLKAELKTRLELLDSLKKLYEMVQGEYDAALAAHRARQPPSKRRSQWELQQRTFESAGPGEAFVRLNPFVIGEVIGEEYCKPIGSNEDIRAYRHALLVQYLGYPIECLGHPIETSFQNNLGTSQTIVGVDTDRLAPMYLTKYRLSYRFMLKGMPTDLAILLGGGTSHIGKEGGGKRKSASKSDREVLTAALKCADDLLYVLGMKVTISMILTFEKIFRAFRKHRGDSPAVIEARVLDFYSTFINEIKFSDVSGYALDLSGENFVNSHALLMYGVHGAGLRLGMVKDCVTTSDNVSFGGVRSSFIRMHYPLFVRFAEEQMEKDAVKGNTDSEWQLPTKVREDGHRV